MSVLSRRRWSSTHCSGLIIPICALVIFSPLLVEAQSSSPFPSLSAAFPALVCEDEVEIALGTGCITPVPPDALLEGNLPDPDNYAVNIIGPNGLSLGNTLGAAQIGQTLHATVTYLPTGNTCTTIIHVVDKIAPAIACPPLLLTCAVTDLTPGYLANTLGLPDAWPMVEENCAAYTLAYLDVPHAFGCDSSFNGVADLSGIVERHWTATDASGNTATCTQLLYLQRRHVSAVLSPSDITLSCAHPLADPVVAGRPYLVDFGKNWPLTPGAASVCGLDVVFTDDTLGVCDGTFRIVRDWTVYDDCMPTNPSEPGRNPISFQQLIKIADTLGPIFACPADLKVGTDPFNCCATVDLPDVVMSDNCSRINRIGATLMTPDPFGGDTLVLYFANDSLTDFPLNNPALSDTLGVFGPTTCLPLGEHFVTYLAEDDCGNTATCVFRVTVSDQSPPVAACDDFTQIALDADGVTYIPATNFDDGSYDDCAPLWFKARRFAPSRCLHDTLFTDLVKFCCRDIGDTVDVTIRIYNVPLPPGSIGIDELAGHFNSCTVRVFVEDKLKPVCVPPADVVVSCENFDPSLKIYGNVLATDNCKVDSVRQKISYAMFDTICNRGTIFRTYRVYDHSGLSSQCTQRISVNYKQDYAVKFPDDRIVTVCDGTGNFGEPTFLDDDDCELLAVAYGDEIFTVVPDACYKIERTWTIINWCTYNPNQPVVDVPNPNPNGIVNHPSNLIGPIVSAPGTAPPWAPSVVKINPGDAQPTTFSQFWTANANGYRYKQIIKIIDTQDPIIEDCPVAPLVLLDITNNDAALWNEPAWLDPVYGLHDLCEGPVDLNISATDLCSGGNLRARYLLFLDLDGNGTLESVISSSNLPPSNTIYYGNAASPDYVGGISRNFDERPVPFNDKYRFGLQTWQDSSHFHAALRWNTPLHPDVFHLPQLPYGKHKIKWIVDDGCGNEVVCDQDFDVKDGKAPTAVCTNGLSINLTANAQVTLWATDLLQYATDNCTPANQIQIAIIKSAASTGVFPLDNEGNPLISVSFGCNELGTQPVQLWTMDAAGNTDFCETYVLVQDNAGLCTGDLVSVAGQLATEQNQGLEEGQVHLDGHHPALPPVSLFDLSDNAGGYKFSNAIPLAGDYLLTPTDDDNPLNGVTTYDLVLMSKHILGTQSFTSPYQHIAADVNHSGALTSYDLVELRKVILGLAPTFPNNTSWRFVARDFTFPNPANPLYLPFPETISVAEAQANAFDEDFVAVKIGDVNGSAIPNSLVQPNDRAAGLLLFDVEDREVRTGDVFDVTFQADRPTQGFQFTLNINGLALEDIIETTGVSAANFGFFQDQNDKLTSALTLSITEANAFTVRFRAISTGHLADMLRVSSRITKAEGYGNDSATPLEIALRFTSPAGSTTAGVGFELYPNQPNPFYTKTRIPFYLPEAGPTTLTVYDELGREVLARHQVFPKGENVFLVDGGSLKGLLRYRVETTWGQATQTMMRIK